MHTLCLYDCKERKYFPGNFVYPRQSVSLTSAWMSDYVSMTLCIRRSHHGITKLPLWSKTATRSVIGCFLEIDRIMSLSRHETSMDNPALNSGYHSSAWGPQVICCHLCCYINHTPHRTSVPCFHNNKPTSLQKFFACSKLHVMLYHV